MVFEFLNLRSIIQITYETSKTASALQWLTPEQTLGKVHPYLFSQCQVSYIIFINLDESQLNNMYCLACSCSIHATLSRYSINKINILGESVFVVFLNFTIFQNVYFIM